MDGVTILYSSALPFYKVYGFWYLILYITVLLAVGIVVYLIDKSKFHLTVYLILGVLVYLILSNLHYPKSYAVCIDESVSMASFNEKYHILDNDGLVYYVTEKE